MLISRRQNTGQNHYISS